MKSKEETLLETETANGERSCCTSFLESVRHAQTGLQASISESEQEGEALIVSTNESVATSARGVVLAAEARLADTMDVACKILGDHKRAKSTLELLEVDARPSDLPTRQELADALEPLRDAWAARVTLGSVDLKRRAEVESLLREASEDTSDTLADAKASWAKYWSDHEELAVTLADAAGGESMSSSSTADVRAFSLHSTEPAVLGAGSAGPTASKIIRLPSLDDDEPLLGPA